MKPLFANWEQVGTSHVWQATVGKHFCLTVDTSTGMWCANDGEGWGIANVLNGRSPDRATRLHNPVELMAFAEKALIERPEKVRLAHATCCSFDPEERSMWEFLDKDDWWWS